jgi:outer membrane protein assembly factor BamD
MKKTFSHLSLIIIVAAFVASCSSKNTIRSGDSLQEAFNKAMAQYEGENYSRAVDAFEQVIQLGRGTEYGEEAQYYLAESYFNQRNYLLAASEYERYSSQYPQAERRQEVDFKEALCYYELSPRYNLDQTYTRQAIQRFNLFTSRYPDSEQDDEISEYIDELRDKLARKKYEAGRLYLRTDRFEAAAIYFDLTIDEYPESQFAEQALVDQIDTYIRYADNSVQDRQLERYEKAVESYERYIQLFPRGENRSKAEDLVDVARTEASDLRESTAARDTTDN